MQHGRHLTGGPVAVAESAESTPEPGSPAAGAGQGRRLLWRKKGGGAEGGAGSPPSTREASVTSAGDSVSRRHMSVGSGSGGEGGAPPGAPPRLGSGRLQRAKGGRVRNRSMDAAVEALDKQLDMDPGACMYDMSVPQPRCICVRYVGT